MRTVRDDDGTRYVLLKESTESSLVRDPETGEQRHVPNADLEPVDGESVLATAAGAVPEAARRVLTAAHDDRALGLLVEIDDRGPLPVQELLSAYDLCESDLHGLLAEFRAAGLLTEAQVHGPRGYDTTETASDGLAHLRD
jgi:hypothetical protein